MISRRDFLHQFAVLTGSVAFGVATAQSDEDWLISADDAQKLGIDCDDWDGEYPHEFRTYREGRINLVIWRDEVFRDRWMKAHRHCLIERPRSKARRIAIFRHYLYGEPL